MSLVMDEHRAEADPIPIAPSGMRSRVPEFGADDSGSGHWVRTRTGRRIGTAMRNIDPHMKCSSRKLPTIRHR